MRTVHQCRINVRMRTNCAVIMSFLDLFVVLMVHDGWFQSVNSQGKTYQ